MGSDEKKNGRVPLSTVIAAMAVAVSLGGSWWAWGQQTGEIKQRITTVEKRQEEDRRDTRDNIKEVKDRVQQIDQNVQAVLQKLSAMEAVQRQQRSQR